MGCWGDVLVCPCVVLKETCNWEKVECEGPGGLRDRVLFFVDSERMVELKRPMD